MLVRDPELDGDFILLANWENFIVTMYQGQFGQLIMWEYDKKNIKDVYELYWLKHYKGFKYLKCLTGFTYLRGLRLFLGS